MIYACCVMGQCLQARRWLPATVPSRNCLMSVEAMTLHFGGIGMLVPHRCPRLCTELRASRTAEIRWSAEKFPRRGRQGTYYIVENQCRRPFDLGPIGVQCLHGSQSNCVTSDPGGALPARDSRQLP